MLRNSCAWWFMKEDYVFTNLGPNRGLRLQHVKQTRFYFINK